MPSTQSEQQTLSKIAQEYEARGYRVVIHPSPGDERFFTTPIGRLRTQLRRELLADELAQIDGFVTGILK